MIVCLFQSICLVTPVELMPVASNQGDSILRFSDDCLGMLKQFELESKVFFISARCIGSCSEINSFSIYWCTRLTCKNCITTSDQNNQHLCQNDLTWVYCRHVIDVGFFLSKHIYIDIWNRKTKVCRFFLAFSIYNNIIINKWTLWNLHSRLRWQATSRHSILYFNSSRADTRGENMVPWHWTHYVQQMFYTRPSSRH